MDSSSRLTELTEEGDNVKGILILEVLTVGNRGLDAIREAGLSVSLE